MANRCAVSWCRRATSMNEYISLHKPPLDEERRKPWLTFINRPELYDMSPTRLRNSIRVCSIHFKQMDFRCVTPFNMTLSPLAAPSTRQLSNDPPFHAERDFFDGDVCCTVQGCRTNELDNPDLPFHRIHFRCVNRIMSWRETLGLIPKKQSRLVCCRHFGAHQYSPLDPKRSSLESHQDPMYRIGPVNPIFNDYSPFPLQQVVLYEAFMEGETIDLALILKTFEGNLSWVELKALIIYMEALAAKKGKSNFIAQIPSEPPAGLRDNPAAVIQRVHDPACTCWSAIRNSHRVVDAIDGNSGNQASETVAISSNPMADYDQAAEGEISSEMMPDPDDLPLWHQEYEENYEDITSANRVLVMTKQDGKDWTMGETHSATLVLIKKLLNLRLTDVKYKDRTSPGCSFRSSSLVSPKLFMILCLDVHTANMIVQALEGDLDQVGWSVDYWPDIRKPVLEAFIPGCIISKVYAMRMMEFFNRGKGLHVGAWRFKKWTETENGVWVEIEVPCEDAFVVQKLETLCFELRLIKFEVKWPKEIDRLMQSIVTDELNFSGNALKVDKENQTTTIPNVLVENIVNPLVAVEMKDVCRKSRYADGKIDVLEDEGTACDDTPKTIARYQTTKNLKHRADGEKSVKSCWMSLKKEKMCRKWMAANGRFRVWNDGGIDGDEGSKGKVVGQTASTDRVNAVGDVESARRRRLEIEARKKYMEKEEQRKLIADRLMDDSVSGRLLETQLKVAAYTGVKTYGVQTTKNGDDDITPLKWSSKAFRNAEMSDCAESPDENVGFDTAENCGISPKSPRDRGNAVVLMKSDEVSVGRDEVCKKRSYVNEGCTDSVAVHLTGGRLIQAKLKTVAGAAVEYDSCQKKGDCTLGDSKITSLKSASAKAPGAEMNDCAESPDENAVKPVGSVKSRLALNIEKAWKIHLANEEQKKMVVDHPSIAANTGVKLGSCQNNKNCGPSLRKTRYLESTSKKTQDVEMNHCVVIPDENLEFEIVPHDGIVIQDVKSLAGSTVRKKKRRKQRPLDDMGSTIMNAGMSVLGSKRARALCHMAFQELNEVESEGHFKLNVSSGKTMKTYCKPRSENKTDQSQRANRQCEVLSKGCKDPIGSDDPCGEDGLTMPLISPRKGKSLLNINGEIVEATEEDVDSLVLIS